MKSLLDANRIFNVNHEYYSSGDLEGAHALVVYGYDTKLVSNSSYDTILYIYEPTAGITFPVSYNEFCSDTSEVYASTVHINE